MKAVLKATDVAREITGQEAVNTVGACAGGMTLALGHLAAKGDAGINAATFMVTVLDARVESTMGLFATPETVAAAKLATNVRGVLEGQEMARIFVFSCSLIRRCTMNWRLPCSSDCSSQPPWRWRCRRRLL